MFVWARALTRLDALEARVLALEQGGLEAQIEDLLLRLTRLEQALRRQGSNLICVLNMFCFVRFCFQCFFLFQFSFKYVDCQRNVLI